MDFRLLGPLEARRDGSPLPLGGRKQRGILAILLLHANESVSVDRIVDDLWGPQPPRTVQAYVQNCISRLRAVLGRQVIETHAAAYCLHAGPDEIDGVRFERAVEAALDLEPPERAAALAEALALWRGPALADFAFEPFAQVEIARFDELRLVAIELRLDAELELGRHDAVLAELDALAARHPSRERLRALQMLALYRAGRQRDALAAYQDARHELVERFGLEPGEELRSVERMILAQDPALRSPGRADTRSEPRARNVVVLVAAPASPEAAETVARHGAVVHGDRGTLAAVFGEARARDDDTVRALRAAVSLRAELGTRVAVDRVPTTRASALAQLLEATEPDSLVIGASLLPLVAHAVDVVPHVTGAYRVLRFDGEAEAVPRHLDAPLVGRVPELERLAAAVETSGASRESQRVVVVGDAGIGKTRLALELGRRFSGAAHVVWLRCESLPEAGGVVAQILAQAGDPRVVLADEPDREPVVSALHEHSPAGPNEELWALRRLLEALAGERPVVLVVDDAQWGGSQVLDLVDYLTGWSQAPIVIVCLGRPELLELRPQWAAEALHIGRLHDDEAQTLARALPGLPALDDDALQAAVRTAEGNPLFLEQLVAWSSDGGPAAIPPTVEMLIESRVERLPHEERRILERAAVVGAAFWRGAVEAASPAEDIGRVAPVLMTLVRKRFLRPARSPLAGQDGFRFHHRLIREVVYGTVPRAQRGALHELIARSLGDDESLDAIAGYHFEQAALHGAPVGEQASRRLGAAGIRALRRIDAVRAVDLLSRAAALAPDGEALRTLDWARGTGLKFEGQIDASADVLEDVIRRSERAGDRLNAARAEVERVWPRLARGELRVDAALDTLKEAAKVFSEQGDDFCTARAWDLLGAVEATYRLRVTDVAEGLLIAERHYRRAGAVVGSVAARQAGFVYTGPTPAYDAIARCESLLAEAEAPVWESFVLPFLAALQSMQGDFDLARRTLETARSSRAEFADPGTLVTSWAAFAAEVELRARELESAERILAPACERLRAAGDTEWLATNTAMLADVEQRRGRDEEAAALAAAALEVAPPGHLTSRGIAERVRAKALARLGEPEAAVAVAQDLLTQLATAESPVYLGEAHLALSEVLTAAGASAEAARHVDEAVAAFEAKGDVVSAKRARQSALAG